MLPGVLLSRRQARIPSGRRARGYAATRKEGVAAPICRHEAEDRRLSSERDSWFYRCGGEGNAPVHFGQRSGQNEEANHRCQGSASLDEKHALRSHPGDFSLPFFQYLRRSVCVLGDERVLPETCMRGVTTNFSNGPTSRSRNWGCDKHGIISQLATLPHKWRLSWPTLAALAPREGASGMVS